MEFPYGRQLGEHNVEWSGEDAIVLDCATTEYHLISRPAYQVWRLADGTRSVEQLAELVFADAGADAGLLTRFALDELTEAGLMLDADRDSVAFLTRRRATRLAVTALMGGVALPVVRSITIPDSAAAISRCGNKQPGQDCNTSELEGCSTCCCCAAASQGTCQTVEKCKEFEYAGYSCK